MSSIEKTHEIVGEKIGTVSISMYRDKVSGLPFFYVKAENEDVIQVSYIVQDFLYNF